MDELLNQVYLDFAHNLRCLSRQYPEDRSDALRLGAVLLTYRGECIPMQLHRSALRVESLLRREQICSEAAAPCLCALAEIGTAGPAPAALQRSWDGLKRYFLPGVHLVSAAALIAAFCKTDSDFGEIAGQTKEIHKCLVAKHPFTATERELPMCAAIALAGKDDWEKWTADCASRLQGLIPSGKSLREVSRILALFSDREECCQRFAQLWREFNARGWKLARKHWSALAVLAGCPVSVLETVEAVSEMAERLKNAEEDCPWSGAAKERLYLACLLVALWERPKSEQGEALLAWFASLLTAVGWETWGSSALLHREIG